MRAGRQARKSPTLRYAAILDGDAGAYGVTFPDLPGIAAMGETVEDALANAEEALRDYVTETERDGVPVAEASPMEKVQPPEGSTLTAIPVTAPNAPQL